MEALAASRSDPEDKLRSGSAEEGLNWAFAW